jgi:hypothetical protein
VCFPLRTLTADTGREMDQTRLVRVHSRDTEDQTRVLVNVVVAMVGYHCLVTVLDTHDGADMDAVVGVPDADRRLPDHPRSVESGLCHVGGVVVEGGALFSWSNQVMVQGMDYDDSYSSTWLRVPGKGLLRWPNEPCLVGQERRSIQFLKCDRAFPEKKGR